MNKTKVVIFDFDHTMYRDVVYEDWHNYCKTGLRNLLGFLPKQELEDVIKKQELFEDLNIIETIKKYNLKHTDWLEYRNNNLRKFDITNATKIDNNVLKQFAEKYKLYIVTHNQKIDVLRVAKALDIDLSCIQDIVSNSFEEGLFSKKYLYQDIIKKENVKPQEVYVIGDDYKHDILPAFEIGARGKQVFDCKFTLKDFDL